MLKMVVLLPLSLPAPPWAHLGVRPAGLISKSEVPFRQGILPVQDGVSQLPPVMVRVEDSQYGDLPPPQGPRA